MLPNLTRYLNKTVFISIPALFEDGTCRPFKLVGAELHGLWLQSDELTQRLLSGDQQALASLAPVVFVPFAQIAGVLVVTGAPAPTTQGPPQQTPAATTAGAPSATKLARKRPGGGE
jgi:hypothetical protein